MLDMVFEINKDDYLNIITGKQNCIPRRYNKIIKTPFRCLLHFGDKKIIGEFVCDSITECKYVPKDKDNAESFVIPKGIFLGHYSTDKLSKLTQKGNAYLFTFKSYEFYGE